MGEDVKQIENKNKNLQIQTENQKLLYKELSRLLVRIFPLFQYFLLHNIYIYI